MNKLGRWATVALWLVATVVGMFLSLLVIDAAFFEGDYIPIGNDSFYHARRMLDFAVGERGFYQFDERIHVPDGNWIPWPWAYDYLMGLGAAVAVWLSPSTDPLGFLLHVPVAWLAVNVALFLAAARQAGLELRYCALAMIALALAPFLQMMHMVGRVDHHFAEFTFVLLVTVFGLRWFQSLSSKVAAIGLGVSLGFAVGFHNGLFVLQIPVLLCVGILWLRGHELPRSNLHALAAALTASTLLIVLPSGPFQQGMFQFGLLSWFHLYIAICSSVVLVLMGWRRFERKSLILLAVVCLLLVAPILGQVRHGTAFLAQEFAFLENVLEATSPFGLIGQFGINWVVAHYSWLLLIAPLVAIYFGWRGLRSTEPGELFFAIVTVFGIALMLTQFRFYYFGLFGLIAGSLWAVQRMAADMQWHRGLVFAGLLGAIAVAYQPPLRAKLFDIYALGGTPLYEQARPMFLDLAERCAEEPGVVLAHHHDGNYVLFHTDCSVVSNTLMLTEKDAQKVQQISEMMRLTPAALREQFPTVRYVVIRVGEFLEARDGGYRIDTGFPLARALLVDEEPPEGFDLLGTIHSAGDGQLYARAYSVRPLAE